MRKKIVITFIILFLIGLGAINFWYIGSMREASADLEGVNPEAKKTEVRETTVKIFFGNKNMNQNPGDCKVVFPVERTIINDSIVKRRAFEEVLLGPTTAEIEQGYYSAIPGKDEVIKYREKIKEETGQAPYVGDEIKINSVKIMIGMAYIDFSKEILAASGDNCRVQTLKTQLYETAKQFSKVSGAIITVGGVENAL